jgi:hypothetical protein
VERKRHPGVSLHSVAFQGIRQPGGGSRCSLTPGYFPATPSACAKSHFFCLLHFAEHGVGRQPVLSGSFLKSEVVR